MCRVKRKKLYIVIVALNIEPNLLMNASSFTQQLIMRKPKKNGDCRKQIDKGKFRNGKQQDISKLVRRVDETKICMCIELNIKLEL